MREERGLQKIHVYTSRFFHVVRSNAHERKQGRKIGMCDEELAKKTFAPKEMRFITSLVRRIKHWNSFTL